MSRQVLQQHELVLSAYAAGTAEKAEGDRTGEAESSSEGAGSSDEGEEREDESSAYEGSSSD
ncbi:hypothetical protein F441_22799 [Phytophthora nicotianae CJ01A1]|uniref:Uncharacterized protein n=1 Tax=Phytophthora nicotianae CJ01A1 TaxID=1317063 RepID=W2VQ54_PHYNI|nr:hypothetical protein F441_22799 [Phytophthora nicotianae CJ01A1]